MDKTSPRKTPAKRAKPAPAAINDAVRAVFMQHHADLLDAQFWQTHKERILAGHVYDVFPYDVSRRFVQTRMSDGI